MCAGDERPAFRRHAIRDPARSSYPRRTVDSGAPHRSGASVVASDPTTRAATSNRCRAPFRRRPARRIRQRSFPCRGRKGDTTVNPETRKGATSPSGSRARSPRHPPRRVAEDQQPGKNPELPGDPLIEKEEGGRDAHDEHRDRDPARPPDPRSFHFASLLETVVAVTGGHPAGARASHSRPQYHSGQPRATSDSG